MPYLLTATASLDGKLQLFLDAGDFLLEATADPDERRLLPPSTFPLLFPSPDSSPISSAVKRICIQSHFHCIFSQQKAVAKVYSYLGSRQTAALFCWRKRPWNSGIQIVRVRRDSVVSTQVRLLTGTPPVKSSSMKMTAHVQLQSHVPIYKAWLFC